jgi:hypothetical protein
VSASVVFASLAFLCPRHRASTRSTWVRVCKGESYAVKIVETFEGTRSIGQKMATAVCTVVPKLHKRLSTAACGFQPRISTAPPRWSASKTRRLIDWYLYWNSIGIYVTGRIWSECDENGRSRHCEDRREQTFGIFRVAAESALPKNNIFLMRQALEIYAFCSH